MSTQRYDTEKLTSFDVKHYNITHNVQYWGLLKQDKLGDTMQNCRPRAVNILWTELR